MIFSSFGSENSQRASNNDGCCIWRVVLHRFSIALSETHSSSPSCACFSNSIFMNFSSLPPLHKQKKGGESKTKQKLLVKNEFWKREAVKAWMGGWGGMQFVWVVFPWVCACYGQVPRGRRHPGLIKRVPHVFLVLRYAWTFFLTFWMRLQFFICTDFVWFGLPGWPWRYFSCRQVVIIFSLQHDC